MPAKDGGKGQVPGLGTAGKNSILTAVSIADELVKRCSPDLLSSKRRTSLLELAPGVHVVELACSTGAALVRTPGSALTVYALALARDWRAGQYLGPQYVGHVDTGGAVQRAGALRLLVAGECPASRWPLERLGSCEALEPEQSTSRLHDGSWKPVEPAQNSPSLEPAPNKTHSLNRK